MKDALRRPASICLLALAPAAAMLAGCAAVQAPPPGGGPAAGLDHYLCYFFDEVRFNPPRGVTIKDQFHPDATGVAFLERDFLCNPVEKRHDSEHYPIRRPEAHLFCYRFDRKPLDAVVQVSNQFDRFFFFRQRLRVVQTWALCLPAGKAKIEDRAPRIPKDLDHYTCYQVKPEDDTRANVNLTDQFLTGQTPVRDAFLLCNPTEKRHSGRQESPRNPEAHLVCYNVDAPTFNIRQVRVSNQFEPNVVITPKLNPPFLCVPSTKRIESGPRIPPRQEPGR